MSKNLVVVFGGRSPEHAVSCASASAVMRRLPESWRVIPVGITRAGAFVYSDSSPASLALVSEAEVIDNQTRVIWPSQAGLRELLVVFPTGHSERLRFDLVFPLLHGPMGEDGSMQGLLELLDLPFVGSGVYASAAAMHKQTTKLICSSVGLRVLEGRLISRAQWAEDMQGARGRIEKIGYPLFVKPLACGSSLGCSWVSEPRDLASALMLAFEQGPQALVERAVKALEIFVAILDEAGELTVSDPMLIQHEGQELYDYEAKYLKNPVIRSANLEPELTRSIKRQAALVHRALGCRVLSRVDFFLTSTGPVLNEINTMPGFTDKSIYASCFAARGVDYSRLLERIFRASLG